MCPCQEIHVGSDDDDYVRMMFEQWSSYEADPKYRAWWKAADAGRPASARMSSPQSELVTPPTKMSKLVQDMSPARIPNPMAKRQLQAAKRLEKEAKAQKHAPKGAANPEPEDEKADPESEKTKKTKSDKTRDKKKLEDKKTKKGKKPRRSHAEGPMQVAMKAYIASKREKLGISYMDALKRWRRSSKRASIALSMPEAERRRRRYT